jgi:hypothetical protein
MRKRVRAVVQAASEGCGGGVRARGGLHCGGVEDGKKKHEISHYKLMRNFMFFFAVFNSPAMQAGPSLLPLSPHPSDAF